MVDEGKCVVKLSQPHLFRAGGVVECLGEQIVQELDLALIPAQWKRVQTQADGQRQRTGTKRTRTTYDDVEPSDVPRPLHPLRSQPGVSDGNSSVSRRQQITFRAMLIFHLIDGLLSTTAAHEVRRAGVLTRGSCHLERSARPHPHRG